MATSLFLGHKTSEILPWSGAIEMVHSASLVHDDLPCMDDAKTRRGRKSLHRVYGQDLALLAGSTLFVEAFYFLKSFGKDSQKLVELLVSYAGYRGIMQGQTLDLKTRDKSLATFLKLCHLKTGSLVSAAVEGPALLWASSSDKNMLKRFAKSLGCALQLADDIKDKDSSFLSLKKKRELLEELFEKNTRLLQPFSTRAKGLMRLNKEIYERV